MQPVPFGVGHWELIVLGLVLMLLFGGSQLPAIGRRLGRSAREARETIAGVDPRTPLRELADPSRDDKDKSQPQREDMSAQDSSPR
jgi:sec-independent protein translocase protein TatA